MKASETEDSLVMSHSSGVMFFGLGEPKTVVRTWSRRDDSKGA